MAAIFVGSGAGAVLGAAYLVAGFTHHAPPSPGAAPATPVAAPAYTAMAGPTAGPMAAPAALDAARPFRFAAVAGGASDLQCLTEAVYFEARGEPERGQKAVAQVVLNRVRHPAFPKTICAVVHQRTDAGCQFSFACAPEPRARDEDAWTRARTIAKDALHGAVMRDIGDATHFESVRVAAFAGLLKVAQIGEHVFYRFGGRTGAAGMFHQTPAPSAEPRLMMASLTEPAPAVIVQAQAARPTPSAPTAPVAATPQAGPATSTVKLAVRAASAPLAPSGPGPVAVTTASAPAVAKPIPATTVKPSVAATPVAQS